jgi:hypothetical protein
MATAITSKPEDIQSEAEVLHELRALVAPVAPVAAGAPIPMESPSEAQPIRLPGAMKLRVSWLGFELPLWAWLVPLMSALLLVVAALALALGGRRSPAPPMATNTDVPAPPSAPATPALAVFDRAAVEAKAPEARTIAEALQLADTVADAKQDNARHFEQDLKRDPTAIGKKATLAQLRKLIEDPVTARQALAVVANLSGSVGPDLLYEVWTGSPNRSEATDLARALLASREERAKASEALSIALELRAAETCTATSALLSRARQVGDRRALSQLAKWKSKRQCGSSKKGCCTADQKKDLDATISALKTRRAPSPFDGT